jgi:GNAT superfamily N-acetyltransferase
MIIRDIAPTDRAQWDVLWQGYLKFYKVADMPADITERTWERFFDADEPVFAMVAEEGETLLGLVHYAFHRNTWCLDDVCYLEDLFAAEAARGKGVGRALIEAVYEKAAQKNATRVYWMTQDGNATARKLYDKVAGKTDFIQYRKYL